MPRHALDERIELAESLRSTDPDAPTLSGSWTAAQLAGHLVLRERSWTELLGRLPSARTRAAAQRAIDAYVAGAGYAQVVSDLADGPPAYSPFRLRVVREQVNLLEYLIHHEDVRRAVEGWVPRVLPVQRQESIWSRLRVAARLTTRGLPVPVRLDCAGHGALSVGLGRGRVTVSGAPEELALVAFGRQRVARVDYSGPDEAVDRLRGAAIAV
ncbi:MAG: TIGR03085 family metal-binding protein [Jatrophihabitantaceae bacterium]